MKQDLFRSIRNMSKLDELIKEYCVGGGRV